MCRSLCCQPFKWQADDLYVRHYLFYSVSKVNLFELSMADNRIAVRARIRPRPPKPLPAFWHLTLMSLDHCQPSGHSLPLGDLDAFLLPCPVPWGPKKIKLIKQTKTKQNKKWFKAWLQYLIRLKWWEIQKRKLKLSSVIFFSFQLLQVS